MNIKFDYLKDYSPVRMELSRQKEKLNQGCDSGFIFYQSDKFDQFDYYIFEDNKAIFPVVDYTGELT
jgi:hypothetical protein